jgi:hypothetical protein
LPAVLGVLAVVAHKTGPAALVIHQIHLHLKATMEVLVPLVVLLVAVVEVLVQQAVPEVVTTVVTVVMVQPRQLQALL